MAVSCTVAIPVYNRGHSRLNLAAIESALAHAPGDVEILVVDDMSTDGTWDALQRYCDPRLRLVRNERNLGLFGNFNRCLALAAAPLVRILCSDDALEPGAIVREVALMACHPDAAVLSSRGIRVSPEGLVLGGQADHLEPGAYPGTEAIAAVLWFKSHYGYNPLNYPSGVLLRRELALRVGGFDTSMRMAGDVDLFLRMLRHGSLLVADHVGCRIGVHDEQEGTRLSSNVKVVEEDFGIAARHRDVLEDVGAYERVRDQLGGISLGLAQRCLRQGDRAAAARFVAVARKNGVGATRMTVALVRLVALRLLLRVAGVRRRLDVRAVGL